MRRAIILWMPIISVALYSAGAQELKVVPGGPTPLYAANPARGYVDFVIHGVMVTNTTSGALTVRSVSVDALRNGQVVATTVLDPDNLVSAGRELTEMRAAGLGAVADIMLPPATLGEANHVVAQLDLAPHAAILTGPVYVALQGEPTSVRVRASLAGAGGKVREIHIDVATTGVQQSHAYAFPLRGPWFERSVPNVTSHHRWNASTEYALDFFKLDSAGSPRRHAADTVTDYYGFGEPVLAADSGTVVAVVNDAKQDYAARRRRDGEADADYGRRIRKVNMMAMATDPYRNVVGNYVVIAHANGEYSMYGHLETGSVTVSTGARVQRGQQIGQVGDTGDSPLVHLHFQISDGPDPLRARSVPFHFSDVRPEDADLGTFVRPAAR